MKKVKLYCFSGSGNTLSIAKQSKKYFEHLGYEVTLDQMEEGNPTCFEAVDFVGLFMPVAVQSTYPIVWSFINALPNVNNQKIFMVDTLEKFSGGIVGPIKKVLSRKGYTCCGAIELKMSSSMLSDSKKLEKSKSKNSSAGEQLNDFIEDLIVNKTKWRRIPLLSDWMRQISRSPKLWTSISKKIKINDTCVLCKKCIQSCPVKAMSIKNERVVIQHDSCNSCMRCVHLCPKSAITVGGKHIISIN